MQEHRPQSIAAQSWTGSVPPRAKSPHNQALGYVIRLERARRRISQEELGFRAKLHRNYVGAIERGEINPTLRVLLKLRVGLGMPLSELIASTEEDGSRGPALSCGGAGYGAEMRTLFAEAVREAASRIGGDPSVSFREERLERALVDALRARLPGDALVGARRRFGVPDWDPQPGGVDLFVLNGDETPALFAELKIDNIEETLWDLFKVAALASPPPAPAAFLAVAAPTRRWNRPTVDCAALFPAVDGAPRAWSSLALFDRYAGAWQWLLRGGRARPTRVPATVEIAFVANERVRAYPGYELRAVEVRAVAEDGWLSFDGDWPAGAAKAGCAPVRALLDPESRVVWMPGGVRTEIQLTGQDTGGSLCMLVDEPPAGWSLPPHRHHDEAETIHVVEGEFEFEVDGTRSRLGAGQSIHIPRGIVHSSANVADGTGRRVVIFSPAGMEEFFAETGAPTPDNDVDLAAAFASAVRHGWEFVADRPPTM